MTAAKIRAPKIPTVNGREVRTFASTLEASGLGGMQFRLDGYASITGVRYDMGAYEELIAGGAFDKTLSQAARRAASGEPRGSPVS